MPNKPLALPNLIQLKKDYPGVYDDLETLRQQHNLILQALGGIGAPLAAGGISVSASNGIIDISITDKHPQTGEDYFAEYSTDPSFASAHVVPLTSTRNFRIGNLPGTTTYWRWYKSTKLGGTSNRVTFGGATPTAVVSGNLSTTNPGPTPSAPQGSGNSQLPGYGYGSSTGPISGQRKAATF